MITHPEVDQYIEDLQGIIHPVLEEIEAYTLAHVPHSRMLSGKSQGAFFQWIVQAFSCKNILEIGTYTGYSALCFALSIPKNGRVVSIDINPKTTAIAQDFISKTEQADNISFVLGDAGEVIPSMDTMFDLAFVDAEKHRITDYIDMLHERLNTGGILLIDNVLWKGKVADQAISDKKTTAIRAINKVIATDKRFSSFLFPLRDGITCMIKR